ncbi:MAG: sugar transferase [Candidatus Pacearchaeota archaeon]
MYFILKRLIDIIFSLIGLFFTVLIFPFIAILIILDDGLPVIIKVDRVSKGKIFKMYKFRSMVKNAEEIKKDLKHLNERDKIYFKIKNDPRITKVGRFLRKFRLDELPQFFNVLKGDISLIGPRPYPPEEILNYPLEFRKLILAKTGITGLAQIYNVDDNKFLPAKKSLELDLEYLKNQSLFLDFKIILKTIIIFLTKFNGY